MKKLIAALVLALGLIFVSATPVAAAETCVDKIISPIIQLPIQVCINVPGVPTIPPVTVPPIVPPVIVPPVKVPPVVAPPVTKPTKPTPTVTRAPSKPVPTRSSVKPAPTTPFIPLPTPYDNDHAESHVQELEFPLAVMVVLTAILFGGYELFTFFTARRAKRLARKENV